jgi:hypothetical protein
MIDAWPKIPEIEVKFQPCERGGVKANPQADLGILGKWDVGGQVWARDDPEMPLEEQITDLKKEVQVAFSRLILRFAAVTLVERGEGLHPIVAWYEDALEELGDGTAR